MYREEWAQVVLCPLGGCVFSSFLPAEQSKAAVRFGWEATKAELLLHPSFVPVTFLPWLLAEYHRDRGPIVFFQLCLL